MSTPLPEKAEQILAWHTEEELKLRGFTRDELREFIAGRFEREKDAPNVGDIAPDLTLESLSPTGKQTGDMVSLSSLAGKPVGLIFGSYT
ncbi:MAG: hypothetical protein GKS01_07030 [Alphaproteobacteria bacterium]|nr:hypothetical protein [Alphaproteobacteria bacterium]